MSEPEKIGKYRILERIGRGGMGTIFKAHDPVLNRPVALKVISTGLEVTDELRARFFREAQACARLSHPNIVTVYDVGEDSGRVFIVMELLEGVELRRLIADRAPLSLEDKLSIMGQVCNGLHYAHQRGIVHRDIKPGNIMRLGNGQVKILDFGIAQIEDVHGTLTRTGLIMGTLRYMAPEQVRGRADQRADIFSVGAVLYEFLSLQPPFSGKDALQLLEQLRVEDPTPLDVVDPTIPSELSDTVARAMRKDPEERFADLEQMRAQIEQVQSALAEEARRVNARIQAQRGQLGQLQAALADRVGSADVLTPTAIDPPRHLASLRALEVDLAARIQAAQGMLTRADALAPAFERGSELLQAGQFADAVAEFEAIVADMPEHAPAAESLARARAEADAEHRRELTTRLVQDARAAVEAGEYTLCLEILKQAAEIPPPIEAVQEIASLRQTAEMAAAAHEAARRARQQAESARVQMAQARSAAQTEAAVSYAPTIWHEAEATATGAEAAFARAAYAEAAQGFDAALVAYRRFEDTAREAQRRERDAAERGGKQMAQGRQRAHDEDAPQYAPAQRDTGVATFPERQVDFAEGAMGRAAGIFNDALDADSQAVETSCEARQGERMRVDEAREQRAEARERSQTIGDAPDEEDRRDTSVTTGGIENSPGTMANCGALRERWAAPGVVEAGSRRFRGVVDDVPRREGGWRWSFWARRIVIVLGSVAAIVTGISYSRSPHVSPAPPGTSPVSSTRPPTASTPSGGTGVTAAPQDRPELARDEPPRATAHRPPAGQSAGANGRMGEGEVVKAEPDRLALPPPRIRAEERGVERRPAEGRRDAEQAGTRMASARREAEQAAAAFYAPKLLGSAQAKEREGAAALARSDYNSAIRLLMEARSDYQAAAQEAKREADTERQIAPLKATLEQARATVLDRRRQALAADAERLARELLAAAEAKHAEADNLATRQSFAAAARAYDEAAKRYTAAALRAQAAPGAR